MSLLLGVGGGVTGTLTAIGPVAGAALSGQVGVAGTIGAAGPLPVVALSGSHGVRGPLGAAGPLAASSITGTVGGSGILAAIGPLAAAALSGVIGVAGTLAPTAPVPACDIEGSVPFNVSGTINVVAPIATMLAFLGPAHTGVSQTAAELLAMTQSSTWTCSISQAGFDLVTIEQEAD